MMDIWKFTAFAAAAAVLCTVLKKQSREQAALVALAGCAGLLTAALTVVPPILEFLRKMQRMAGMNAAVFAPVLKTVAVGLLSQIAEAFCRDAGEQALAKAVEIGGGILALYTLLPLAGSVAELLQRMMTG